MIATLRTSQTCPLGCGQTLAPGKHHFCPTQYGPNGWSLNNAGEEMSPCPVCGDEAGVRCCEFGASA